jgi:hypothetical protein
MHLPDFYRDWVDAGLIGPHDYNIYLLFEPEYYNLQRMPTYMKERVRRKYNQFFDEYLIKLPEGDKIQAQFERVLTHMYERDLDMLPEFKRYTHQLDRLRKENFAAVFPELAELV